MLDCQPGSGRQNDVQHIPKNAQGPFFGPSHALHAKPPDQKERNHVYKFIALSESQASAQIQHL